MLWFANLQKIRSVGTVYDRFSRVGRSPQFVAALETDFSFGQVSNGPVSLDHLRTWQKQTRHLLTTAVTYGTPKAGGKKGERKIDAQLDELLHGKVELSKNVELGFQNGTLQQSIAVLPFGLWACCQLAAVLLIDRSHRYVKKELQQCDAPITLKGRERPCGKFVIDWRTRRGRPEKYCSKRCRIAGTRAKTARRVAEKRARSARSTERT